MTPNDFYNTHCYLAELKLNGTPRSIACGHCKEPYFICQCELTPWQKSYRMMMYPDEFILEDKWWKNDSNIQS